MPDQGYQPVNFVLQSKGVSARYADDSTPPATYLLMTNLEEIEENGLATRLGSTIINKVGTTASPLSGPVHSLSKLAGLNGTQYRYASSDGNLYRRSSLTPGAYTLISSGLSGEPWTAVQYNPSISSFPYLYIADQNGVLKDNGTLAAPQNAGIKQPQYPVRAQAQAPDDIVLDPFRGADTHVAVNIGSYTANYALISATLTTAVVTPGIHTITIGLTPNPFSLYDSVVVNPGGGNEETVVVLQVTTNGFIADFTNTHLVGETMSVFGLSGTVAPSTTGSITLAFTGHPIAAWPTTLSQQDYIKLDMFISFPLTIQSITLKFDCGDGTFQSDFFWRTIGQGPLQSFLDANTDSSTAAADAVLAQTLGLFSDAQGGISGLNTGNDQWTSLLMQLSDFSSTGRAAFDDPVFNWNSVNGYQIEITTNSAGSTPTLFQMASLQLVGGAGPDSFAGVAYDYLFTFFNIIDYTESNPCMVMTNIDPPNNTNWVLPRRQPVELTMTHPVLDPQTTHLRIYRRGGTLADNYRRLDQVPCIGAATNYTDILSDLDIQSADTISFTNDVPVTSSLPVPVNTALTAAVVTTNAVATVTPADMTNISVGQQVSLGDVTADNFEIVIVLSITGTTFNAFVQNTHAIGESVSATAEYAKPVGIVAVAFDQGWYAEDENNPSYLYYTPRGAIQYVSSAAYVPVSVPSDPITAIVPTSGNLFVSTNLRWWSIAPGSTAGAQPTVYPTRADHGCVGKNAWCLKDGIVYYLATDGPRVMIGGDSQLISDIVRFVWQGVGPTPIPIAAPIFASNARVSWWQNFVFFVYTALSGGDLPTPMQFRLIWDVEGKRWRNDDFDAQSIFLEKDTNQLVVGDTNGMVHLDRLPIAYDEINNVGVITQQPIAVDLETPYNDQGQPAYQKNYNEFTLDANTNGTPVTVKLNFNDGEFSHTLGPITTTERERINLNLNDGDGYQAYKVSMELTTDLSTAQTQRVLLYQAKLKSIVLAMTRQSYDSYWLRFGTDENKAVKQGYFEYNAGAIINGLLYYDGSSTPEFSFTLPQYNGIRNPLRVRFPAIQCRMFRCILTSTEDFQLWDESHFEVKPLCQGKSYARFPMMS